MFVIKLLILKLTTVKLFLPYCMYSSCWVSKDSYGGNEKIERDVVHKVNENLVLILHRVKRYKNIRFHLLDLALCKSYMLYYKSEGSRSPIQFRSELFEI